MTAAVAFTPDAETLEVRSDLLGSFTTPVDDVIEFPHGLLGFAECRRFALVRAGKDSLYWLQSLEYTALAFLLVDPFSRFPDYAVDVAPRDRFDLGVIDPADLALLAIVTLPPPNTPARPTVNLQGPIAVNLRKRVGIQLICAEEGLGVRRELAL